MRIGLIAHDAKKNLMQNFCVAYKRILGMHDLYATGTTGLLVEKAAGLQVHKLLAGPLGGTEQLSAMIESNQLDALIFLRDPRHIQPRGVDVNSTVRLCDLNNIPIATNLATAEILVLAIQRGDLDWRQYV